MNQLVGILLLACILAGCSRSGGTTVITAHFVPGATSLVTRAHFDRIETGMSQDALRAIFGHRPTPQAPKGSPGQRYELVWIEEGREIHVQLLDDRVTGKSQVGL